MRQFLNVFSFLNMFLHLFQVRRKSKAYKRLFEGDSILSVNDQSCKNLTYDQVMEIADKRAELTLEVQR